MEINSERYNCQIGLPGFGLKGQNKLKNAQVLIVGAGGLGCACAQYLVSSGIGTLGFADFDIIQVSNLHRQILYNPTDAGELKVEKACSRLKLQNPDISLIPISVKITSKNAIGILASYDIIVDCSDNFETKYLLNDTCFILGKPLVYGAIYQYLGQLSLFNILNKDGSKSPNFRDLFPKVESSQIPNCESGGVLPTLAGLIGCLQAGEVIKYLMGMEDELGGRLWIFDARTLLTKTIFIGHKTQTLIQELKESVEDLIPTISYETYCIASNSMEFELIDVRDSAENQTWNIGGIHIPLHDLSSNLEEIFLKLNLTKPLIFYCTTGNRSREAVILALKRFPYGKFYSLKGGILSLKS